ncbi:cubilin [Heterocephalus glaber]|uniref:Cubilin n=1 Tax=Heterocephalus glaber TaxID=10181 RepID=A0A0P6JBC8_HETGA|nr:cubilin [Heterocephalus glaber]
MSSPFLWSLVILLIFAEFDGEAGELELQRQKRNTDLQQPRLTSERGNLVFLTGPTQNIEFRTGSLGKIKINDEDFNEFLQQIKINKEEIIDLKRNLDGLHQNVSSQIYQLNSKLVDLERRFQSLQQTVDKDVCRSNPCRNGGTCHNLLDSFFCICPSQWEDPLCSTDVNECVIYSGTLLGCQNGATCVNTVGSYSCTCKPDTYGPQCGLRYNDCEGGSKELCVHGVCEDLERQQAGTRNYTCICEAGWTSLPNHPACIVDRDECSLPSSCSALVQCFNTPGSFYCGPCPKGWQGNGYVCEDIDECEINNGGCSMTPLVRCVNTPGSFICEDCPPGYQGDGKVCTAIDICLINNGGCHPHATCLSSHGLLPLCTCLPGYTGNGYGPNGCVQLGNVCLSHPCLNGQCTDTVSGYFCKCDSGWAGVNCTENINECLSSPCLNGGTCVDGVNAFSCECTSSWTGSHCQIPQQACGGSLSGMNGSISYRISDVDYLHDVNCFWIIRTEEGKVLHITFTFFQLELENNCPHEFLQIHDGDSSAEFPLGRFCGSTAPQDLHSSDHVLYFHLHSDHLRRGRGFTVQWETQQPECGGRLAATYGSIQSPGYPGNYPPGRDCVWSIITSPELLITFTFGTLSLENHEDCSKDYLEIRDGPFHQDPILGRFCTTSSVPPLQTTGPFARIHFHSDNQISDRGFHITYLTSPSDLHCGGNYTDPEGELFLPSLPEPLAHNRQCVYIIQQPQGELIDLTFTHVELEGQRGCSHSYIEVRNHETLLGKVCGNETVSPIRSITNNIWIRFKIDTSVQKASFRAFYQVVCGGELTGEGIIHSPFYPNVYPGERTCRWTIHQPQGQVVLLNFTGFEIGSSNHCDTDYVEIGSSSVLGSPENVKYCGTEMPSVITSVYNVLYVTFVKSPSMENRGFVAVFSTQDLVCGKTLTASSGIIKSPGHPSIYPSGVNCTWNILVQPGQLIRLVFDEFHLEFHYNCTSDYVEVHDTGSRTYLGRYCGKSIPPSLTSSTNSITLTFVADSDLAYEGFSMNYTAIDATKACSEDYTVNSGTFTSPNFPNHYPHDYECIYRITVEINQQIALHFTNFSLEDGMSGNCVTDFVEIRDGGYENSPLVGKFCGSILPPRIISHSNKLWLKFKSDSVLSKSGFSASWDGSLTGCGGNLTTSTGMFTSPNYPMPYYHSSECYWWLKSSHGSPFELTFKDFHLEYHLNCSLDYLDVYDGPSTSSHLLTKLCGDAKPPRIRSSGDSMLLKLRTDEGQQGGGFEVEYSQRCENVVIVNQTYGILESINYPNPYSENQRCSWTIQATRGNTVNYTFAAFDLEYYTNCSMDYLELYDGPRRIGRYCGTDIPPPGSTTASKLQVLFHTDGVGASEKGFQMQWVVHGCGGELFGAMGSFSSPEYPGKYPPNKECIWYIHTAPGSQIQLTIHDFDVEYESTCQYDVLEVYGGPDFHAPRLTQLCAQRSSVIPMQVSSTGNELAIRFKTDSSVNGRGFNASWQALSGGCGGIFHAPNGEIHSPDYPNHYRSNSDCSWVIQVEKYHRVLLNITDFDLEPPDSCITTHDGVNSATARLASVCGRQQLTNPITSSGDSLFVRFQSGASRQSRGFRAQFRQVCGGYVLTNSFDTISSPLYPAKYPHNQNCSWIIQAQPPFNHITLSFTHFGLQNSRGCTLDYIEILDGSDSDAPLRGRYCGFSLPHPITSYSRALTLRFISDSGNNYDGFHALYAASTSACGGNFHRATGTFETPSYPDVYPPNSECVWSIISSPGNRIQLSFISFQLEDSQNCSKDFVEIREGNATGPLVGRYCGSSLPRNYSSITEHLLWIRFVSDGSSNSMGFQATFTKIFGNDNIEGTHGKIASPFWPANYPPYSNYKWTVNVNMSQTIHGRILEMDIESAHNCYYDKLKIYDGADTHSRLIGIYCGTETQSFSSRGNSLMVQFLSDSSVSGKGFLLEWFAVDNSVGSLPTITPGACGGFLRTGDTPAFLFSPGWPGRYSNAMDCSWLIQAPGSTVELNILSMDIESHQMCDYDSLVIRNGDNDESPLLAVLCGTQIPGPIRSTGEYLSIHFSSDLSITRAGFNASFHKSCGGYLHADRGIITSPKYPMPYPPNLNCSWHVLVQPGFVIAVHFEEPFQIPSGDAICSQGDYLVLKNGPDIYSPPLGTQGRNGRFCGGYPSSTLFTSDNQMFVQFISDNSNNGGRGFKMRYEAKSLACGGYIYIHDADSTGYVTSPNYPNNYPPHADCVWIISAPPGKSIRIQFEDQFDIEDTPNCFSSYLELRNGGSSSSPVLSKFCGMSLPGSQLSSTELMYLRFQSNSSTHTGFKAKYSMAQCGGTVTGQSGSIESIGYPTLPYPNNLFCQWQLQGLPGHYLTIHFEDFNLQNSSGCEKDFVEIWENLIPARLLGRYCGNAIPQSIDTSSDVASVRFVTDDSLTAPGFRLWFESSLAECGGDLQGPTGTFTSPNYPNPNPHGRVCEWRITVQEGRQATLTFNNLRLEAHPSCSNEHVIIFNGIRSNSPQLEKLCSSVNVSNAIKSSGNTMKVVFFTDGSRPYGGFSASYTSSEDAVCGGFLTNAPEGNFTSPGYDGVSNYSRNLNCEWTLSNPNRENSSIYINFVAFSLESHQDCQSDVLEFRADDSEGPLLGRYCGPTKPTVPLVIPYPQVWIHFVTNEREEHTGFHAEYFFTDCGGIQTGEAGVITSPNYPGFYRSLAHCAWLVEAPVGRTITLTFSDFDIETHSACAWDSVTVRNGGSPESPIIGQYCGNSNPRTIQSGSNQLTVIFNSDKSMQSHGFYATWSTQTLGCGGIFHSDNGTIRSPHWPQNFPENSRCSWTVITQESKHFEISFDSNFRIPSGNAQCQNSFVKVWAGPEQTIVDLLSTWCGDVAPSPIIIPRNAFTLAFQSQEAPAQGFSAAFVSRCGYNFTSSSGSIISPNFPKRYDNNMNCTYLIKGHRRSVVILTFESFHLEGRSALTGSCDSDGVHILRGDSVSSTPVATVCGEEMLDPMTLAAPVLLNFYSNSHVTDFGFKFSYQLISCGGTYNASAGIITSPSSSENYPNNIYCLYKIFVRNDRVVLLKFRNFDVVPSAVCSNDFVAIYDGSNISDPLLGKFCGSKLPPVIKSSSNSMLLVFKTDAVQTARGWRAAFRQTLGPQHGCGGYLTGSDSTLLSPDSDSNGRYDKHLNCIWFITAPVNKVIKLTFNTFALENESSARICQFDYVKLYDGDSEDDDLVGTFCGSTVPAPFISSGNFLTVQFITDLSSEREGFNATYTFLDRPCGGMYNATWTPQNASSPRVLDPSFSLFTCTWVIEAPHHEQVKISVWELQLQSEDCAQNYLEFQDAPEISGNPAIQVCGRNASSVPALYSSTRTAVLVFKSDNLSSNSRVSFNYQIADCNRHYRQGFGTLRSPGWPDNYYANLDCTIILSAPQNHTISLFFDSFSIESGPGCVHDFLEIRNGSDSSSPLLGTYCGSLLPDPVFSQSPTLYLHFKSDNFISRSGYEITWTSSPFGCGGILRGDSGSLASPGYPGSYPNHTHCEWALSAPSGRPLSVSFYLVSIDDPGDCALNYLVLHDGPDATFPAAGPYCGADTSIAPFVASSSRVFIVFHAEYSTHPSAFRLMWHS